MVQGIVEEWQEAVYGCVLAVWHQSWRAPSMICQLDMGNSRYATIHANYWRAQIEEENRWQRKISL